jgi:hypothetical protein
MKGSQPLHISAPACASLARGSGSQTLFANLQPRKARPPKSAAAACTPRGRGPSGRFLYHFLAAAEGSKKMMQLRKMKHSFS